MELSLLILAIPGAACTYPTLTDYVTTNNICHSDTTLQLFPLYLIVLNISTKSLRSGLEQSG